MRSLAAPLVVLALAVAAGCGSDDEPAAQTAASSATPPSTSPGTTATAPATVAPVTSGDETAAIADLAARLGVDASTITTVLVENVTWRDSGLGCPQPGMSYLQVLTDGTRIVLKAEGTEYAYHSGGGRAPFYCESPEPPAGS